MERSTETLISSVRLFKALPEREIVTSPSTEELEREYLRIAKRTIRYGFLFSPSVVIQYPGFKLAKISETLGLTPEEFNETFHKSWSKIEEADIETLIVEQILHYITTYGLEDLGLYNKDSVYIPGEKLEIPEVNENYKLVIIGDISREEMERSLDSIITSDISLSKETIDHIYDIIIYLGFKLDLSSIKNRELTCLLCDKLGIFPKQPSEFLRYLIYKATGKTLLIKSKEVLGSIKTYGINSNELIKLVMEYEKAYGLSKLSEVFYRFKPIFLSLKTNDSGKYIINRIRKLAKKHHKPMEPPYLETITGKINRGERINRSKIREYLKDVTNFRKVRLANALNYRIASSNTFPILYHIRNGKGFSKTHTFKNRAEAMFILDIVLESIVDSLGKIKGKTIYIPSGISYALPTSEKKFVENFPFGTSIKLKNYTNIGVHWKNQVVREGEARIDLDLSILLGSGEKIGWDGKYRSSNISISGDMTDAPLPKGASEVLLLDNLKTPALLMLNYYNHRDDVEVPYELFISEEKHLDKKRPYLVDPNSIKTKVSMSTIGRQDIIGVVAPDIQGMMRLYFVNDSIGLSISSSMKPYMKNSIEYYISRYSKSLLLSTILREAGAEIVNDEEGIADIDVTKKSHLLELFS